MVWQNVSKQLKLSAYTARWLGRRSLAGGLSVFLTCAPSSVELTKYRVTCQWSPAVWQLG